MNDCEIAIDLDLNFRYEDQKENALTDIRKTIPTGRCIVLCGSSGCGKSTLLRCMNQLIPQFYEGELKGFCRINGKDCAELSIGEVGQTAASVFQDPRSQFFTLNSSTEVAFGLENFGFSHDEMVQRTNQAFEQFHLEALKDSCVFELSGGQRQLIAILSAWAMDADILLLDEPTANLDGTSIEQLRSILQSLKDEGKTLVISEHRLSYLSELADEYWRIDNGHIADQISAEDMRRYSPQQLLRMGLRTTSAENVVWTAGSRCTECAENHVLKAENLCFSYGKRQKAVLNGVSLEVHTGEAAGLVGAIGCGKTTFGKLAAGLLRPSFGHFLLDECPISQKALRNDSIFIMQEAEFQFFTNSVLNELTYRLPDAESKMPEIERQLKRMNLWQQRSRHPFSLSGGQMQKLVLLLAYFSPKPIAVLDEPTAGLDAESLQNCVDLIREMQRTKIVLIITHDLELIAKVCTRCIALSGGIVEEEFDLTACGRFEALKEKMLRTSRTDAIPPKAAKKKRPLLDARLKLFIVLTCMVIGIWTDLPLILSAYAGTLAAAVYERRWKIFAASSGLMAGIVLLYAAIPNAATSFIVSFFPRIFLIAAAVSLLMSDEEIPRTLAAMRKLRVPERVIMIFSVAFRFFPVLSLDLKLMSQSIQTRGFFKNFPDKIKAIPEYAEILIVPMVFRVIRIAEALSASAETRGIALKNRRDSFIELRFRTVDIAAAVLFAACITVGLVL